MDIKYVKAEDWQGLYFDGELIFEGHEITLQDALEAIVERKNSYSKSDFQHMSLETYYVEQNWMEEIGEFPKWFSEIPREVLTIVKE